MLKRNILFFFDLQKTVLKLRKIIKDTNPDLVYAQLYLCNIIGRPSVNMIKVNEAKITYWISEPHMGVFNALNKGIAASKGEYCLFLNSGDWLYNNDSLFSIHAKVNTAQIVSANFIQHIGKRMVKTYFPKKLHKHYFFSNSLPHPATFISRSLFDKIGFYNELHKIVSDWEFFLLAIKKNNSSFKKLSECISVYNLEGISNNPENSTLMIIEREEVIKENFPEQLSNYHHYLKNKNSAKNQLIKYFHKVTRFTYRMLGNDKEIIRSQ